MSISPVLPAGTRTSNLELPTAAELRLMIQKESPRRAVHRDYLVLYPEIFVPYRNIAQMAGIDVTIIDDMLHIEFDEAIRRIAIMNEAMIGYAAINQNQDIAQSLYSVLNLQIPPVNSDLIFVCGSPRDSRIEKAVELYHEKIAPKIIVTGAAPHWGSNTITEADRMAEYAHRKGVPTSAIITENQSIALPDNVKRSLDLFETTGFRPQRVTIVTSEFNTRRACMDIYKFFPYKVEITTSSPRPSNELSVENWIYTERGRRIVLNEYAKLLIETKIDQIVAEDKAL